MTGRCVLVRAGAGTESIDGVTRAAGVSKLTAGAQGLCVQISTLPPGAMGKAHLHEDHESAVYVLEGEIVLWFGERLEEMVVGRAGDFLYIPANMPHLPLNASDSDPVVAIVARTDPNEQESLTVLPHLDGLPHVVRP